MIYWTEARIVASMQTWADAHHGVPPSCISWRHASPTHPSFVTTIERFGSFNAALEAAGFVPHHVRRTVWPRERILQALRDFNAEHGRPPMYEEWRHSTPFTPGGSLVQDAFGSWNVALAAAGFGARPKRCWWTKERVIEKMLDHLAVHGRWPSSADWKVGAVAAGRPNASTVIRIFGSWAEAVAAARGKERPRLRLLDAEPFGAAVRGYIGASGSYVLVAELAGVDEAVIRRLAASGKKFVREDTAEALATALDRPDLMVAA